MELCGLEFWALQAGTGLGMQTCAEGTMVKDVLSVGGETTSTACAQKFVLIGCTKLKFYFRDKNKAGGRNPDLDLTATSAVEDFRVRVLSAHHMEIWVFNRPVEYWHERVVFMLEVEAKLKTIHLCHLKCLCKLFSFEST